MKISIGKNKYIVLSGIDYSAQAVRVLAALQHIAPNMVIQATNSNGDTCWVRLYILDLDSARNLNPTVQG